MSVIIPIYNKAGCLENCLHSLESQTAPRNSFEAILIDDGSTDNSLEICRKLENRHSFVKVISKENGGVSSARNAGMAAAKGAYLLFLDADDSISKSTIENLIATFDRFGEETDVVAYTLEYYYPKSGKTRRHRREKWLTSTGLYPLDEYPYVAQSTMNVCIRNRFADNISFDSSIKMGEDQLFVTRNLERKGVLGYCAEALYRYVRDGSSSSAKGNNPLYAFDDMIALYSYLATIGCTNEKMASYARQLILYNFDWRIASSTLFPDYCTGEEHDFQMNRLAQIARSIPPREYAESPYLNEYFKAMLLDLYGLIDRDKPIEYTTECAIAHLTDGSKWTTVVPKIVTQRCAVENGSLILTGRLVSPTFLFSGKPTLSFGLRGKWERATLNPSSFNLIGSHYKDSKAWSFTHRVRLDSAVNDTIEISLAVEGATIPNVGVELKPAQHNCRLAWNRVFCNRSVISAGRSVIHIEHSKSNPFSHKLALHTITHPKVLITRTVLRLFALVQGKKRIWLYSDLPTSACEGNALAQMLYDLTKNDGIERYYVSEFENELATRHPELRGKVVRFKSRKHQVLSLRSELVLSSYLEKLTYQPMYKRTYNQIADLAVPQRRVYLQHGILHAHMPWYFSYDRIAFDYEVISTDFERENLTGRYCFPPDALIDSGAPRLDEASAGNANSRKILYVPSWRNYLVGGNAETRMGNDEQLTTSTLYFGMKGLIEQIASSGALERNDWTFELKLHPNFNCYRHLFDFDDPRISLAPDNINISEYSLVITDFSSYVYDFVYSGADVIYFLPDHVEFKAGLNHYNELDLPFEEGFGPYFETPIAAAEAVERYLDGTTDKSAVALYRQRRRGFFLHRDGKNRERLYAELRKIADSL